jgi:transmembrane sensor
MSYPNYSVEDFVTDAYFISWVKSPNDESDSFWNSWLTQYPHKKADVYKARDIILMLDIKEDLPAEGKFLETWEKIATRIDAKSVTSDISFTPKREVQKRRFFWYHQVAAGLLAVVLSLGGYSVYQKFKTTVIQTSYGESRTFFLPDSTKVTLNANSSLHYIKSDFQHHGREVWLDGEAFFSVVRKTSNENFKVHTKELEVEVLGTRFDVNSRRGKTKVVLEEGKVKVDMNRSLVQQHLVMSPGDFVEVSKNAKSIHRKLVNPDQYFSWRNNKLEFNGTTLREIGNLIEDNYGYQVVFVDEKLTDKKFTGNSSSDDLQELTQKLSRVFDLKITQEENVIMIDRK